MRLAWPLSCAFLFTNRRRFYGALAGVLISVALMQFQTSMVAGFLHSAKSPIRALNAQIWVTPKHQPSFEFASTLPRAYHLLLIGLDGVADAVPVVNGFASLKTGAIESSDATIVRASVALIGVSLARVDAHLGKAGLQAIDTRNLPIAVAIDVIDRQLLGVRAIATPVEINGIAGEVTSFVDGYATFLGAPYAFVEIDQARRMFRMASEATCAVAIFTKPGMDSAEIGALARNIGERFPEVSVMTAAEYESRSAIFWLIRTGAGGGLLLSAVLGFVIGFIIISQTLFALTIENVKEFATLRAIGVPSSRLMAVLLLQAGTLALAGALMGAILGAAMVWATRAFVLGWVMLPLWLPPVVLTVTLLMGALASLSSVRMLYKIQAADAFRQ